MKNLTTRDISVFVRFVFQYKVNDFLCLQPYLAYESRLYFVTGGSGKAIVNGVEYPLQYGDLLLYRPGVPYQNVFTKEDSADLIMINFDYTRDASHIAYPLQPSLPEDFNPEEITDLCQFSDFPLLNDTIYLRNMFRFEPVFQQIEQEFREKKLFYAQRVEALVTDLLFSIMREVSIQSSTGHFAVPSEVVPSVIEYIQKHYAEPLTNHSIAKELNYCAPYLSKLMRIYTGKSLHQYLLSYRLSQAMDLLTQTQLPVTEIAFRVGFSSLIHLEKVFKEKLGYSPGSIRHKKT